MINRTVSHYKILSKLGEGGMGSVYQGLDLMLERRVAIKVVHLHIQQPGLIERFRSEAALLARLSNPHIAAVYSFFRQGDEFFLVMEFVDGQTLAGLMRGPSPPGIGQSVAIVSQLLSGLEHAHNAGILHRDIKPANILVTPEGAVKITDFGIGRALDSERLTRDLRVVGTPEYLAPERIRGEGGDARADLYAAGVVLYELLAKHLPFERPSDFELLRAHLEDTPLPFSAVDVSIPPALAAVVWCALAKNPLERYASAADMRDALIAAETTPELPATRFVPQNIAISQTRFVVPMAASLPEKKLGPRPKLWFGVAGAAIVTMLLIVLFARMSNRHPEAPPPAVQEKSPAAAPPAEPRLVAPQPATVEQPPIPPVTAPPEEDDAVAARRRAERARRKAAALQALDQ